MAGLNIPTASDLGYVPCIFIGVLGEWVISGEGERQGNIKLIRHYAACIK
jgi:hypothetical protein